MTTAHTKNSTQNQGIEWNIHYDSICSLFTHPKQLAAVAIQNGHTPVDMAHARILELGCATGGNLTPIAASLPSSECIGIDPFVEQIDTARRRANNAQITNVKYLPLGVSDLDQIEGKFDYIIAHGLYSWIPEQYQKDTLQLCREKLSPQGIAYISYNTYPGWHQSKMLRHLLKWQNKNRSKRQVLKVDDDLEQIREARSLINVFGRYSQPSIRNFYAKKSKEMERLPDWYIVHEYLLEHNYPFYFEEFIDHLSEYGLTQMSDCTSNVNLTSHFLQDHLFKEISLINDDYVAIEQGLDFLCHRSMRRSLVTHQNLNQSTKKWKRPTLWGDDSMSEYNDQLFVAAPYKAPTHLSRLNETSQYIAHNGKANFEVNSPEKHSIMLLLSSTWPNALSLETLITQSIKLLKEYEHNLKNNLKSQVVYAINELIFRGIIYEPTLGQIWSNPSRINSEKNQMMPWLACEENRLFTNVTNRYHDSIQINPKELMQIWDKYNDTHPDDFVKTKEWQRSHTLGLIY
jgi:methyltransferase-like protein/SAM-dependent methyltransferase